MAKVGKNQGIAIVVGIGVVLLFFIVGPLFFFGVESPFSIFFMNNNESANENNLVVQELDLGSGNEAQNGDRVAVHYTGRLEDGTIFDSSLTSGQPFVFILGRGEVIQGWDLGVLGMKVGGTRILSIPPELAYGSEGIGPIPPNARLIFEVTLIAIEKLENG